MSTIRFRPRLEDDRLVRGTGRYVDDEHRDDQVHAAFVRSLHAQALIRAIDTTAVRADRDCLAVFTGADLSRAGLKGLPAPQRIVGRDGKPPFVPHWPALAGEVVHHVGQTVAMVVARTAPLAQDLAERIAVEYEERPAVVDPRDAVASDAPRLHAGSAGNVACDWQRGDTLAAQTAIDRATHVIRLSLVNQRLIVNAMEPRAAIAQFDPAGGYTLHAGNQGPFAIRDGLARMIGVEPANLRIVCRDVGGGFGMKTPPYPEYAALLHAAKALGRPVRWTASRGESFLSDTQARDSLIEAELALGGDGRILALRVRALSNMGAFLSPAESYIATATFASCLGSVYRIPVMDVAVICVLTNTVPVGPYRGAGRPEGNLTIERLMDEAARVTGIDRIAFRRRNMIEPGAMPYAAATGHTYDSGEFAAVLDKALALGDVAGFEERRRESAARGMRRGLGVGCFLEMSGGPIHEHAAIDVADDHVELTTGTQSNGQGHETVFAEIAAERLGIARERVRVVQGDSASIARGIGSFGSRSLMLAGSATLATVKLMIERGRALAAHLFEAAEADIVFESGVFAVVGTDRRMTLFELARTAGARRDLPAGLAGGLSAQADVEIANAYPNGCHIAEVEIDPETGATRLVRYSAVDDCGTVINPTLVDGQIHGGIAQGLGQVLLEHGAYDRGTGQLLSGSFMDYALPRADTLAPIEAAFHPVACRTNALGAKGVGEAGTTGALCAVMNAVVDAIGTRAAVGLAMPATPERIWRALGAR